MDIKRKKLRTQYYLYVDKEVPYGPEIGPAMGAAFGEVFGFVKANGITPRSMPMSVYVTMDPNILRFRGGVMVLAKDAKKAEGAVKSASLPAGEVLTTTHIGPYDGLNHTHQEIWNKIRAEGIHAPMPVWEIYVDDPMETPPHALRTEVFHAIGPAPA